MRGANKVFDCFSSFLTFQHIFLSLSLSLVPTLVFDPIRKEKGALSVSLSITRFPPLAAEREAEAIERHMGPCGEALMTMWDAIPCYGVWTTLTWSCTDGECTHVACTESLEEHKEGLRCSHAPSPSSHRPKPNTGRKSELGPK